jgi:Peptidase family M23
MASHRTTARRLLLLLVVGVFTAPPAHAASVPDVTAFPVVGNVSYIDDFGAPRPGGPHHGNDIMSVRHQPAIAFEPGTVEKWPGSGGCMLVLHGKSGMTYWYIHLNNDLGPTNDNKGGCKNGVAYAPGLRNGQHVWRGQLVGFVGDSGDANGLQPHLHFEVHTASGKAIDPYPYLRRARHVLFPRPHGGLGDVTLTLKEAKIVAKTSSTVTVKTKRILVAPLGLGYVYVRNVTLAVPPGATIRRKTSDGQVRSIRLKWARIGWRARVTTQPFTASWPTQLAGPGALSVRDLLAFG